MIKFSFDFGANLLTGTYSHKTNTATISDGNEFRVVGGFRAAIMERYPGAMNIKAEE